MPNHNEHVNRQAALHVSRAPNLPSTALPAATEEEEIVADVDEPPEHGRTPRPATLKLQYSSTSSFTKSKPRCDQQQSLLTSALQATSNASSPVEAPSDDSPVRGTSAVSMWSNNSLTTADLTSDGGFTSPVSRISTPSPPLPSASFRGMIPLPLLTKKPSQQHVSIVHHGDDALSPLPKLPAHPAGEQNIEAVLGRKRCIMFACGNKDEKKAPLEDAKPPPPQPPATSQTQEPSKRLSTIQFACPSKLSSDAPIQATKARVRMASPPPAPRRMPPSPKAKVHRDSDATVRNNSPMSVRKPPLSDRARRLSLNSDLARTEAYRFHEFASSEEEVEEWTQVSTCHRNRLTVSDTLKIENGLRQLGEEAEEEALEDDDEDEDDADEMDDDDDDDDDDEELVEEGEDESDNFSDGTDEGFQTDDENGFAVSDDESDAGSDYNWWAPGASTAATSVEHLEQLRLKTTRPASESSVGSLESRKGFEFPSKMRSRRKKSKPVNIRAPSPELPDSTDFVCGTLDEDRPLEEAYMSTLERRRAAKHKPTPQDIDPTFPTSDPDVPDEDEDEDEEDEVSEVEKLVSESDNQFMMHGRMDHIDGDGRGRRLEGGAKKRSPLQSPKRLRSPPPAKRTMHRSPPPPRKLFGGGSTDAVAIKQRSDMAIRFGGLAERPALMTSASAPRTPLGAGANPLEYHEDEAGSNDMPPMRRAIDIKIGLEKKRQRRKEKLYRKQHRKAGKEKRPAPGRGAERMREMGLAAHAHKGKTAAFNPWQMPTSPDVEQMHVLSV
ncbi:hypothetical protein ACEQ8H_003734 [Pleosporales sp. CAS-2024a]